MKSQIQLLWDKTQQSSCGTTSLALGSSVGLVLSHPATSTLPSSLHLAALYISRILQHLLNELSKQVLLRSDCAKERL